ncbi:MAG: hypothetical protein AAGA56_24810 [Myxococcota bacterium]
MDLSPLSRAVSHLERLAAELDGFELVPGVAVSSPSISRPWRADELAVFGDPLPAALRALLLGHGGIEAIDIGGGVGFLQPEHVVRARHSDDAAYLSGDDGPADAIPSAVNGGGEMLLLARDNGAVFLRTST